MKKIIFVILLLVVSRIASMQLIDHIYGVPVLDAPLVSLIHEVISCSYTEHEKCNRFRQRLSMNHAVNCNSSLVTMQESRASICDYAKRLIDNKFVYQLMQDHHASEENAKIVAALQKIFKNL